ncbi:MAG: sugar transferase [Anaerolineae bacterium]|nr:sugar transferase [Anaerolineae bacterium]
MYYRFGKRLLDLTITIPALIFLSPVLAVIALLVQLKLGAPVIFRQQRPGQYGQPFTILKFRTLTNARDAEGQLLPDAERLTPFGRFLRQSSLDELPELINIVKGEMSLVGPRPLLMVYLNKYSDRQMRRQEAQPGLTGWAQINGRNGLTWEEKFNLDVWYVEHCSLLLDLKIMGLTLGKVLNRAGINQPGHATMVVFQGSPNNSQPAAPTEVVAYANGNGAAHNGPTPEPSFKPEFKAKVVIDVLSGVKSAMESCREYNLSPQLLAKWQADFLENAPKAFQSESRS